MEIMQVLGSMSGGLVWNPLDREASFRLILYTLEEFKF